MKINFQLRFSKSLRRELCPPPEPFTSVCPPLFRHLFPENTEMIHYICILTRKRYSCKFAVGGGNGRSGRNGDSGFICRKVIIKTLLSDTTIFQERVCPVRLLRVQATGFACAVAFEKEPVLKIYFHKPFFFKRGVALQPPNS